MFIAKLNDVLDKPNLDSIQSLLPQARFVDGRVSGGSAKSKHNLEMAGEDLKYVEIINLIERSIRCHREFNLTAFPRRMTRPIISRYECGMFYREHVDMPVMGFMDQTGTAGKGLASLGMGYVRSDLSMTLFLSAPDTYDGGELRFEGLDHPIDVKLEAGSAILYPTGARHSVTQITRGVRVAAVFWIQTMFPVESHRRAVYDSWQLFETLQKKFPESHECNLAEQSFFNLCRIFADV